MKVLIIAYNRVGVGKLVIEIRKTVFVGDITSMENDTQSSWLGFPAYLVSFIFLVTNTCRFHDTGFITFPVANKHKFFLTVFVAGLRCRRQFFAVDEVLRFGDWLPVRDEYYFHSICVEFQEMILESPWRYLKSSYGLYDHIQYSRGWPGRSIMELLQLKTKCSDVFDFSVQLSERHFVAIALLPETG